MSARCDVLTLLTFGPGFMLFGIIFVAGGLALWFRPKSWLARFFMTGRSPDDSLIMRIIAPLNGTIFFIAGLWFGVSRLGCQPTPHDFRPLIGPVKFFFWPPMVFGILFAGLVGTMIARQMRPIYREVTLLLVLAFGFAGAEAAAFHVGLQAERWFAISFVTAGLASLTAFLGQRKKSETPP